MDADKLEMANNLLIKIKSIKRELKLHEELTRESESGRMKFHSAQRLHGHSLEVAVATMTENATTLGHMRLKVPDELLFYVLDLLKQRLENDYQTLLKEFEAL